MNHQAFIDSGAFIAFLVQRDRLHQAALELFSRPPSRLVTSVLVVSETYSWFLHRSGEEAARTFRRLLCQLPSLQILGADERHLEATWRKLDEHRGSQLTFVDASSLVRIAEEGIGAVWGTDHHLAIEGATVVPGP